MKHRLIIAVSYLIIAILFLAFIATGNIHAAPIRHHNELTIQRAKRAILTYETTYWRTVPEPHIQPHIYVPQATCRKHLVHHNQTVSCIVHISAHTPSTSIITETKDTVTLLPNNDLRVHPGTYAKFFITETLPEETLPTPQ